MFHHPQVVGQAYFFFCWKRKTARDEKKMASSSFVFFCQDVCYTVLPQPGDRTLLLNVTYTVQCTVIGTSLLLFSLTLNVHFEY